MSTLRYSALYEPWVIRLVSRSSTQRDHTLGSVDRPVSISWTLTNLGHDIAPLALLLSASRYSRVEYSSGAGGRPTLPSGGARGLRPAARVGSSGARGASRSPLPALRGRLGWPGRRRSSRPSWEARCGLKRPGETAPSRPLCRVRADASSESV